jgi:hypothetical protein
MTHSIVHLVDQKRHGHFERAATFFGHGHALGLGCGLENRDADFVIARLPPAVGRMRFPYVNRQESNLVLVALVDFFQDPRLGSIRASGEAAENQHDRLSTLELRQPEFFASVLRS